MFYDTNDLKDNEIYLKINYLSEGNPDKNYVPAYHFYICLSSDDTIVGCCDLRIGHNKNTYLGGNIGYEIYESFRGNHFAAKACLIMFELAKKHNLDYLHITCNPDNYPSRRTCEYAGGVLLEIAAVPSDNEMYLEGEHFKCIYFFDLNKKALINNAN